jgi:thiamine biosynthesis lipoprotein ApbE
VGGESLKSDTGCWILDPVSSILGSKEMRAYQNSSFNMGTRFNLLLPGIENSEGDLLFSSCDRELIRLENMLSCFMPGSDISQINENALKRPVEISDELFDQIKY